jgi:PmbA protein
LAYDGRITNSEGGEFSNHFGRVIYASSQGFSGEYSGSTFGHSVAPVAKANGSMQRDYWYSSNRKFSRLESPKSVGEKAAQRTLRRLGACKVKTCEVPVVFDPEMAGSLLRNLSSAISGYSLYKGASFLIGKLGAKIASESVTVIDDGTIPGALVRDPSTAKGFPLRRNSSSTKESCEAIYWTLIAEKNWAWSPLEMPRAPSANRPASGRRIFTWLPAPTRRTTSFVR